MRAPWPQQPQRPEQRSLEDDQSWRDAVQTVPGYDRWTVLTAGRRAPDPLACSAPSACTH